MNTLKDVEIENMIRKAKNKPSIPRQLFAKKIVFDHNNKLMSIKLNNGRYLLFSLDDYPFLKEATPEQRDNWQLLASGIAIHWEDINEDLSVKGFIRDYIKKTKSFIAKNESVVA